MGFILGVSGGILDARDAEKIFLCLYLLSTCIRVSAGSSIRPLLYTVCDYVLYTVGVGVYIGMCMSYTMCRVVILFVLCVLIRVGVLLVVCVMG